MLVFFSWAKKIKIKAEFLLNSGTGDNDMCIESTHQIKMNQVRKS
jgi:hypothetical protein